MSNENKTPTNKEYEEILVENKILQDQLNDQINKYKQLSTEIGTLTFENEDLDYELRKEKKENEKLIKENEKLIKEIKELREFKKEIESSKMWKFKTSFKK